VDALTVVVLVAGLALLVAGAEVLVRGASALAVLAGISPLVVGLTVVAYGTSSPELAVAIQAGLNEQPDVALGNVVGSNVCNVLLVLGLCATVTPLFVQQELVRRDVPIMIGVSLLLLGLVLDGRLSRLDGCLLLAGVVLYSVFVIRQSRKDPSSGPAGGEDVPERPAGGVARHVAFVLLGLGLLVLGGRWLVDSAVDIAEAVGVSELVIGLTVVAVGTSMPEIATSLLAVLRGERDMAVGNVVGSNIFNVLLIAGATGVVTRGGGADVPDGLVHFDLPVMTAVAVACLPVFFTGCTISRWEGVVFVGYYVAYTLYLLLDATGHDGQQLLGTTMLLFVLPITVITLAVLAAREWQRRHPPAPA
jgi:cation:H+ antiporter